MEIIQKDARYIRSTIIPFLKENADKRISDETLDHYKNFTLHQPDGEDIVIAEISENNKIIAVSVAAIRKGQNVNYSTTVTDKNFRKKGFGLQALTTKLEELKKRGLGVRSLVAEDNLSGMTLCHKAGLKQVDSVMRLRAAGQYTQAIWTDPPQLAD